MLRTAVLDDERLQAEFICRTLSIAGHECFSFSSSRWLVHQLDREKFHLLVLDWNAPLMSARDVLHWVRQKLSPTLPVIVTTSLDNEPDVAEILNLGADGYIVKPVSANVLLARVGSVMRRANRPKTATTKQTREVFEDFEFDVNAQQLFVDGARLAITQKEFHLALQLFRNLGRPVSRVDILDRVWKQEADIPSRTLDTHVSILRSKLGLQPMKGYRLTSVRGYGYCLEKIEPQACATESGS